MKKNFNVNIGGIIFHIDEDAYDKLSNYLDSLKRHFSNAQGREEIMLDIENRIAELLQLKVNDSKQVIVNEDVAEVMQVMGSPSDFGESERLDPPSETARPKRLFREPEEKVIGGVCGGLGLYFHVDPLWFRIGFIVIALGFGTGILAYILLWLFVPEARTTAEKLEMKGEAVNINNIERSIKDELNGVRNKLTDLGNDAKDAFKKEKGPGKNIFERIFNFILKAIRFLFRVVVVSFGLVFIVIGVFLVIGILISLIDKGNVLYVSSLGISTFSLPVFLRLFLDQREQTIAIFGLCMVIGIPLIMLIYTGARLIFRFKSPSRFVGIPAFSFFLGGLIIVVFIGIGLLKSFNHKAMDVREYPLVQPKGNLLKIDLKKDQRLEQLSYKEHRFIMGNWNMISSGDTNIYFGLPQLEFIKTEADSFHLSVYATARGDNFEIGRERSQRILYEFNQNDSGIILDPFFYLRTNDKFRGQGVKIVIHVPLGKSIYLGPETAIFYGPPFDEKNVDLSGNEWIMLDDGLKEKKLHKITQPHDSLVRKQVSTVKSTRS